MSLPRDLNLVMKAPAPFARQEKEVNVQGLRMTTNQQSSLNGYLKTQGLDPAKGTLRNDVLYYGEGNNGYGVFVDKNKNVVVTGSKADSPSGVKGSGFAIDRGGKTKERSDVDPKIPTPPPVGPGQQPGGNPFGPGGGAPGGFGGPGAPPLKA